MKSHCRYCDSATKAYICIYSNGSVSETKLTNDVEIHYHREILEICDQTKKWSQGKNKYEDDDKDRAIYKAFPPFHI